jgi:RNA recognition motif-containing protein
MSSFLDLTHEGRSGSFMSKLYVGNLPRSVTESSLEEFFNAAHYQVEGVKLIRDMDTGLPRGFAFVELASGVDADKAIQDLNGQMIEGRKLVINEARPQRPKGADSERRFDNRPRHGGGGGRGRGGGGGRKRF